MCIMASRDACVYMCAWAVHLVCVGGPVCMYISVV